MQTSPIRYDFFIGILRIHEFETKRSADSSSHIMIPKIQIEGKTKQMQTDTFNSVSTRNYYCSKIKRGILCTHRISLNSYLSQDD